jgi:NDP-sugar pyrophosphorylase family protein
MTASPTQRFRPITVEKPKVLLPLVNAPLLEYTLEWLALNGMEEVGYLMRQQQQHHHHHLCVPSDTLCC